MAQILLAESTVTRTVVKPATTSTPTGYRFEGIGRDGRFKFDHIIWVPMPEFKGVVRRFTPYSREYGPDFRTFDLNTFFDYDYQIFPWLLDTKPPCAEPRVIPKSGFISQCPFEEEDLLVPWRWCMGVLKLVEKGITHFERRTPAAQPVGISWKPHIRFRFPVLTEILLKV